jgi:electron transfer flavoprotein alpha subunit
VILAVSWDEGGLGPAGLEVLGAARELAAGLSEEVAFAALGADGTATAEQGASHGANRVYAVEGEVGASGGEASVGVLADLARELEARAVVLAADEHGAEVGPRLAERLGGAAVTHVLAVEVVEGRPVWTRPVFGGKALAKVAGASEPVVATLRRGAFAPAEESDGAAAVETVGAPAGDGAVRLVAAETAGGEASLEEASVIVAGGAGLGGPEAFTELEELAGLLGGAVGASLAAVDAGWAAPELQVGLTGKVVSPDVYLALGISGASQHLAGIGGAKAVVAVNTDPDAPVFAAARLGVVMDSRQFLRAAIDELRRRGGQ